VTLCAKQGMDTALTKAPSCEAADLRDSD